MSKKSNIDLVIYISTNQIGTVAEYEDKDGIRRGIGQYKTWDSQAVADLMRERAEFAGKNVKIIIEK